ncbi:MAG: hypothetical protein GIW95_08225 [Candidatus Eremiobacteraeota bacterium]|nr:hypothetical protein [Candidatus Eremiobacteraeota bacterium]
MIQRFFQLLTAWWRPTTRFDAVVGAGSALMVPLLLVAFFGQNIWHWTSSKTGTALDLTGTAIGIVILSIALTGFVLWPSLDRAKRDTSLLWLGVGIAMVSNVTSLGHGPGTPDIEMWFRVRVTAMIIGFAAMLAFAVYMVRSRTTRA